MHKLTMMLVVLVCLLCAASAFAVTGDMSGAAVYSTSCDCWSTWQIAKAYPVSSHESLVFFAASFPNGTVLISGPVAVTY